MAETLVEWMMSTEEPASGLWDAEVGKRVNAMRVESVQERGWEDAETWGGDEADDDGDDDDNNGS